MAINNIVCPQCGKLANYILTQEITITACANCFQATVHDHNMILRLDPNKFLGQAAAQREFIAIAATVEALYRNWEKIVDLI